MDRMTDEEKKMIIDNAVLGMAPPPGGMAGMRAMAKALRGKSPAMYNRAKVIANEIKGLPKELQMQKVRDLSDPELQSILLKLIQ